MSIKRYFLFLAFVLTITSCQTVETQVIEEVFQDGTSKMIIDYQVSFGDSIPIHRVDFHENGAKRMEGSFVDGERDGEWLSWYHDGAIWSKGYFKNGKRTGKSWVYHPNGRLYMEGTYKDGKKTGLWIVYDEEGIVAGQDTF